MSFSNRNTKQKAKIQQGLPKLPGYVLAKTDLNHYLKFVNYDDEIFKTASSLTSKPIISFYQSDSKVVIDYTLANTTDKKYLSSFFAKMNKSNQFNISKASYLNDSELEANLGCTLTYELFNEYKIFASVNSVISKNSAIDFYDGEYFIEAPQLSKSGNLNSNPTTKNMALVCVSPKTNSLISMGIQKGDAIEIINSSSANNKKPYTIKNIEVIKGQELISFEENTITSESLIGSPCIVNTYIKTNYNENIKNLDDTNLGCCFIGTDEQLITYLNRASLNPESISQINNEALINTGLLVSNSSEKQCVLRTGKKNNFFPSCSFNTTQLDVTSQLRSQYIPSQLDTVFYVASVNVIDVSFNSNKFVFKKSLNDLNNMLYYEYKSDENTLYLTTDLMFRFDQTNPTNSEKIIRFSLDENKTMLYQTNIFGKFTSTGKDSLFYVNLTSESPDLYMFVENNQNIMPVKVVKK